MKILILGYGSMGRRRIRLIKQILSEISFVCVDNNENRLKQIEQDGLKGFERIADALCENPDIAFVCTSPGYHAETILELIDAGVHVFTELNLVSCKYDEIIKEAREKNIKVFMSSPMLYDKQILAIMRNAKRFPEKHTYIYHVGQYLPDWHPWENYKDFFVSNKATNGCREILAVQLPWIIKLFGKVSNVSVVKRKNTNLDLDYDDTLIISFEHNSGDTGVFVCDVLARKAINYLEIMGERSHIIWNGTPESLTAFNEETKNMKKLDSYDNVEHIDGYADIIFEEQYLDEIKVFLDWINGKAVPSYTLEEDQYILALIDKIEGKRI